MRTIDKNNALNQSSISNKFRVAFITFILAFSAGNSANAADIEIYQGITTSEAESGNKTLNPNLLFVLDTSGSMKTPEAVENARTYDPTRIYNNTGVVNDKYYVYETNGTYTGASFNDSGNHCQASKDFLNDPVNASFPGYFDEALIWQYTPGKTEPVAICDDTKGTLFNDTVNVPTTFYNWTDLMSIPVSADDRARSEYSLKLKTKHYRGYMSVYFRDSGGNDLFQYPCYDPVSRGVEYTCTFSIPANAVTLAVDFYTQGNKGNSTEAELEISYAEPGVCPDKVTPATGDWVQLFDKTTSTAIAVECEKDDDEHGPTGGQSTVTKHARYQGDSTDSLSTPKYAESPDGINNVAWNAVTEKYIYSGNYHEFLQMPIGELLGLDISLISTLTEGSSASAYCRGSNARADTYIFDSKGILYQCISRVKSLKIATKRIFESLKSANVGLMRMNNSEGGALLVEVADIDDADHRKVLLDKLAALPARGATPLNESLVSAFRYYTGRERTLATSGRYVAKAGEENKIVPDTEWKSGDLTPNAARSSGGKFKSPISQCEDNNIVLLSDGGPTYDNSQVTFVNNLTKNVDYTGKPIGECKALADNAGGDCLDDLAGYMANTDVLDDVVGDNRIYTYTVAFGSDLINSSGGDLLKSASDLALKDAGTTQHFNAVNADQLTTAFNSIVTNLSVVENDSFVSPAVAVNAFNRLQFRNDLYFALFKPETSNRWNGNIKKYRITARADIVGRDGVDAIGADGFFKNSAKSFWQAKNDDGSLSDEADGPIVGKGGVANQLDLTPKARQLYISLDPAVQKATLLDETDFLNDLLKPGETLTATYPNIGQITDPDLTENRENIVKWSLGKDVAKERGGAVTDPNFYLGESLHGTPFVADYGVQGSPNDVLFFTTNQGLLHAIDGDTGEERWAYIPDRSLLPNLGAYFNNEESNDNHKYGLDGEVSFSLERKLDGTVDEALMFLGQRRGGSKYFAIDVSNAALDDASADPVKNLWTLEGLPRMGQSWARPVPGVVNYCSSSDASSCADTKVLFISGGYDTKYDHEEEVTVGTEKVMQPVQLSALDGNVKGNAIYMVRQSDGKLLWMAGNDNQVDKSAAYLENDKMTHSFPSEPTLVDADFDGVIDFFFAVDIAGRVWRFDFSGNVKVTTPAVGPPVIEVDGNDIVEGDNKLSQETSGGIIAELSAEAQNRRFYNRLDISLSARTSNDLAKFTIVTGSGYRAHPLTDENPENNLYVVYDRNISFPKFTSKDGLPDAVTYNYASGGEVVKPSDIPFKHNGDSGNPSAVAVRPSPSNPNPIDAFVPIDTSASGANHHGFYIKMDSTTSEKMLNPTLTDAGIVLAVSYSPETIVTDLTGNICQKNAGSSSLYQLDLKTGEYGRIVLKKSGISAKPVIIEVVVPEPSIDDPDDPPTFLPPEKDPLTNKILIIGSESFDASDVRPQGSTPPEEPCDGLWRCQPKPDTGEVNKVNWWERRL